MSTNISRSRGRVTGQVVSTFRNRVLDGDVLELARLIILERGDLWT
jgi:microcompartment protein CcmK/EutM